MSDERDRTSIERKPCPEAARIGLLVHELRGPLTVIHGYLDHLARPLTSEQHADALAAMRRATERLERMLADAAAGREVTSPAPAARMPVRLRDTIAREIADFSAATGREVRLAAEGDPVVLCDEGRLAQVLVNLLTNADKYSPAGEPVEVGLSRDGERVVLTVDDRGPGIPEADRERVFQWSERLERDAELPGSGFGLPLVREIVEAHGGSVAVLDAPGGGTRVRVELEAVDL